MPEFKHYIIFSHTPAGEEKLNQSGKPEDIREWGQSWKILIEAEEYEPGMRVMNSNTVKLLALRTFLQKI